MKRISWLATSLLATAISTTGHAVTERAGDFSLTDHNGDTHQLSRYSQKEAVVLISQSNICPIPPHAAAQLQTLRSKWEDKGVAFMMINGAGDDAMGVKMKAMTQRINVPILVDANQMVTKNLSLSKAGEIVVLDPENFSILYRGPFDQRINATLENVVAGVAQDTVIVAATGCDLGISD